MFATLFLLFIVFIHLQRTAVLQGQFSAKNGFQKKLHERELLYSMYDSEVLLNFESEIIVKSGDYPLKDQLTLLTCTSLDNLPPSAELLPQIMRLFTDENIDLDMRKFFARLCKNEQGLQSCQPVNMSSFEYLSRIQSIPKDMIIELNMSEFHYPPLKIITVQDKLEFKRLLEGLKERDFLPLCIRPYFSYGDVQRQKCLLFPYLNKNDLIKVNRTSLNKNSDQPDTANTTSTTVQAKPSVKITPDPKKLAQGKISLQPGKANMYSPQKILNKTSNASTIKNKYPAPLPSRVSNNSFNKTFNMKPKPQMINYYYNKSNFTFVNPTLNREINPVSQNYSNFSKDAHPNPQSVVLFINNEIPALERKQTANKWRSGKLEKAINKLVNRKVESVLDRFMDSMKESLVKHLNNKFKKLRNTNETENSQRETVESMKMLIDKIVAELKKNTSETKTEVFLVSDGEDALKKIGTDERDQTSNLFPLNSSEIKTFNHRAAANTAPDSEKMPRRELTSSVIPSSEENLKKNIVASDQELIQMNMKLENKEKTLKVKPANLFTEFRNLKNGFLGFPLRRNEEKSLGLRDFLTIEQSALDELEGL